MILGVGEERVALAIDQRMDRALGAGEELLDDHGVPGIAEDLLDHRLPDGGRGLLAVLGDHDPFAEGEPIGLHHQRIGRRGAMSQCGGAIGKSR